MTELRQRRPRIEDPQYLAWLRLQGCACGCGSPPKSDAAHLRADSILLDKPITGMQRKPDDKWALPLRHDHHMAQHEWGDEVGWWNAHGIDPFERAQRYYARYLSQRPAEPAGAPSATRPRKPKARAKAAGRPRQPAPWPKKRGKIPSRPFPSGRKFRKG